MNAYTIQNHPKSQTLDCQFGGIIKRVTHKFSKTKNESSNEGSFFFNACGLTFGLTRKAGKK
jgi:hypothetical protein